MSDFSDATTVEMAFRPSHIRTLLLITSLGLAILFLSIGGCVFMLWEGGQQQPDRRLDESIAMILTP